MTDIVDRKTRSRMMSGIRSRNTRIEITVRKRLFSLGFRYRINDRRLPGKPDMVFPKYRAVIFTHGCFWHGHDCKYFRLPSSNRDFWQAKISRNKNILIDISLSIRIISSIFIIYNHFFI